MRDPTTRIDPEVETAIEEARIELGRLARRGLLHGGSYPDWRIRTKARLQLMLAGLGHPLSENVRRYLYSLVNDLELGFANGEAMLVRRRRSRRVHKGRRANTERDKIIADTVARIKEEHGIDPTRNRERSRSKQHSGCSIVAKVLGELGINLTERGVEEVWACHGQQAFAARAKLRARVEKAGPLLAAHGLRARPGK